MRIDKALGTIVLLAAGGCATQGGKVEVRPLAVDAAQVERPAGGHLAEARAQFALGNVALALDLYRKAARAQPGNREALAGMAACYERVGRTDLSRRYLEQALASAPRDPALLTSLAAVVEGQGKADEAAALRQEAQEATLAAAPSLTVSLAPAAPPPRLAGGPPVASPPPAASVTLAVPLGVQPAPPPMRLERLSPQDVALVTLGRTAVRKRLEPAAPAMAATRVRLLNAARVQGLAARTRLSLSERGWTLVAIGDAQMPRERSLILFAEEQRAEARRLAAQLGLPLARDPRPGAITVLLGRDAARPAGPRRS